MITWEFYSKRTKLKLETYLRGVKTYEAAIQKFKQAHILPPESLRGFYQALTEKKHPEISVENKKESPTPRQGASTRKTATRKSASKSTKTAKTTKTTRTRRKATPKKKEEPVQEVAQEQTVETKDEKKQYFRKIIKPEKK